MSSKGRIILRKGGEGLKKREGMEVEKKETIPKETIEKPVNHLEQANELVRTRPADFLKKYTRFVSEGSVEGNTLRSLRREAYDRIVNRLIERFHFLEKTKGYLNFSTIIDQYSLFTEDAKIDFSDIDLLHVLFLEKKNMQRNLLGYDSHRSYIRDMAKTISNEGKQLVLQYALANDPKQSLEEYKDFFFTPTTPDEKDFFQSIIDLKLEHCSSLKRGSEMAEAINDLLGFIYHQDLEVKINQQWKNVIKKYPYGVLISTYFEIVPPESKLECLKNANEDFSALMECFESPLLSTESRTLIIRYLILHETEPFVSIGDVEMLISYSIYPDILRSFWQLRNKLERDQFLEYIQNAWDLHKTLDDLSRECLAQIMSIGRDDFITSVFESPEKVELFKQTILKKLEPVYSKRKAQKDPLTNAELSTLILFRNLDFKFLLKDFNKNNELINKFDDCLIDGLENEQGFLEKFENELQHFLEQFSIDQYGLIEAWRQSNLENQNEIILDNIKKIIILEKSEPGITQWLIRERNIKSFARYSSILLIAQETQSEDKTTPYGVIIVAREDYNGAFSDLTYEDNLFSGLEHHLTRIIEVDNNIDAADRLLRMVKKYGKSSFLVIHAHGTAESLLWEETEQDNQGVFELEDLKKGLGIQRIGKKITYPNAPVLFISCSTGEEQGVAQHVADYWEVNTTAPNEVTGGYIESIHETANSIDFKVYYNTAKAVSYDSKKS